MGPPDEWLLSRVCEEFGCPPSVAVRELRRDMDRVFDIISLRAYARAKAAYDQMDGLSKRDRARLQADPLVKLVMRTDFELAKRERDERQTDD